MGRVARITVLALAVVLAGLVAQPAWAAAPLPSSMAAIGDSITRAYDVCCSYGDHPGQSWSTGSTSYDGIASHYERIRQLNPAIAGRGYNDAVSGAKMAAATQAAQAVSQGARYVTILLGANDLCTSSPSTMTPTETFRAQFSQAMATLMAQDQDPYVLVSSIPNIHQLWEVPHQLTGPLGVGDGQDLPVDAGSDPDRGRTPVGGPGAGVQPDPGRGVWCLCPLPLGWRGGLQLSVQRQPGQHPGLLPSRPQRPGGAGPGDLVSLLVAQHLTKHRLRGGPRGWAARANGS